MPVATAAVETVLKAFEPVLSATNQSLTLDPWASLPAPEPWVNTTWGMMEECSDNTLTEKCYVKYTTSGLERFVIYENYHDCAHSWVLLPGFNLLEQNLLIVVYLFFLGYLFLGIAIISDVFMSSIEVITSKEKTITHIDEETKEEQEVTVLFWNPTVANLTLMALGSSAPEILLAIIETLTTLDQEPGELGPATIVGSAAFNLLAITAVCMMSVPEGEVRRIDELPVFIVTALFSLFAYVWLLICYTVWTPDEITIWEGLLTSAFFPILVFLAYLADKGYFGKPSTTEDEETGKDGFHITGLAAGDLQADRKQIAQMMRTMEENGEDPSGGPMSFFKKMMPKKQMNRMEYRMNAIRGAVGRKHKVVESHDHAVHGGAVPNRVHPEGLEESTDEYIKPAAERLQKGGATSMKVLQTSSVPVFAFASPGYSVLETQGILKIGVLRGGPLVDRVCVDYHSEDGTATVEDNDYKEVKGTLVFEKGQNKGVIEVEIIKDDQYEPDEWFYVFLSNPTAGEVMTPKVEVTIIDDDEPGILQFEKAMVDVLETANKVTVNVKRTKGCDGKITCDYKTMDNTAMKGVSYTECSGTLTFEPNEANQQIDVFFPPGSILDVHSSFYIALENPTGGAQLSKRAKCMVTFVSDDEVTELAEKMVEKMKKKMEVFQLGSGSWAMQFREALVPECGVNDDGDDVPLGTGALIMHYLCITWKLVFAVVPPPEIYGGWPTFVISLMMIGINTAIVGEVAALLGCAIGIADSITAISFVALGTSLPDTFASRQATMEAENADAAIGNVTGSNSVNVFLGLGLPWMLASIYYSAKGEKYVVLAGDLAFSVGVYTICAVACMLTLVLRRHPMFGGGELGGGNFGKRISALFFFGLWMAYVIISALNAS